MIAMQLYDYKALSCKGIKALPRIKTILSL